MWDDIGADEDMASTRAGAGLVATRGASLRLPPKPAWRQQLAPGVHEPGEGMVALPLNPSVNGGVFDATHNNIQWTARPQRPFRGERIIAIVTRSAGVSAIPVITPGIFVGTHIEAAQLGEMPLETFQPNAFGVRLMMVQAEPGIDVSIPVQLRGPALAGADTLTCSLVLIGREVR